MKPAKLIMIFFISVATLMSCNKDDDNRNEASLIGTWKMTERTIDGQPSELNECERKMRFIFSEVTLTAYTYDGENCELETTTEYTYSRNGNNLRLESGTLIIQYTIESLTETTLKLSGELNDSRFVSTFTRQ